MLHENNKYNHDGKKQVRYLVLTNFRIFNIRPLSNTKGLLGVIWPEWNFQRTIEIKNVKMISLSNCSSEFVIHVPKEYDYRLSSVNTDSEIDEISRDEILEKIVELHLQLRKKTKFPFFFHETPFLNQFQTSKKDHKLGISKIPNFEPVLKTLQQLRHLNKI